MPRAIHDLPLRVFGSFALLATLVLASSPDPRALADAIAWIAAIVACVAVPELAHCEIARRRGLVVGEIVLGRLSTETPADNKGRVGAILRGCGMETPLRRRRGTAR
jgi:hypothetical protein